MQADIPKMQRRGLVAYVFTPHTPVKALDLLAGRQEQIGAVIGAVPQAGYHVALYGERGVGKTSLANVLVELFDAPDLPSYQSAGVNCTTIDGFDSLWRNVFREVGIVPEPLDETLSPDDVRYELARLDQPAIIVIDELDRLEDDDGLTLLADTIKTMSDHSVPSTIVLCGVAGSIGELIGEHSSIVRNLAQIEMPRMRREELALIVQKGCERAHLRPTNDAIERIAVLSEGLAHYTHLLALHAATRAVEDDRDVITFADVEAAIPLAVAKHTMESDYDLAIRSTRPDALYRQVLLACALVKKNDLGLFTSRAIRDPLQIIAGRLIDIPQYARHLAQFLEAERGAVLWREGQPRRYFYRFSDPMMQPYVILDGLATGLITNEQLDQIYALRDGDKELPTEEETSEPPQLF